MKEFFIGLFFRDVDTFFFWTFLALTIIVSPAFIIMVIMFYITTSVRDSELRIKRYVESIRK